MSAIVIYDNDGTVSYAIGSTPSSGPFVVDFPYFFPDEIAVFTVDAAGLATAILPSGFSLTGNPADDGFWSGSVTLHAPVSNITVRIDRNLRTDKATNFPETGVISIPAMNTLFSRLFSLAQDSWHQLKLYVDMTMGNFVSKTGDTMTGPLHMQTILPPDDFSDKVPNTFWIAGALAAYAPLDSPPLIGDPTSTPPVQENGASLATTHWVHQRIDNLAAGLNYRGTWNASTNAPAIASSVGVKGDYYLVAIAGATTINGVTPWAVGDSIVFSGTVWQKVPSTLTNAQIIAALGYTPVNKAGDTMSGNLHLLPSSDFDADSIQGKSLAASDTLDTRVYLGATGNTADKKFWWATLKADGSVHFDAMNDATTTVLGSVIFDRDGVVHAKTPPAIANDDRVATTKWVRDLGLLFASQLGSNVAIANDGLFHTGIGMGPVGNAGEVWKVEAGMYFSHGDPGRYSFVTLRLFDGIGQIGQQAVVVVPRDAYNVYAGLTSIVTIDGAKSFALQSNSGLAAGANMLGGSWITAQRIG